MATDLTLNGGIAVGGDITASSSGTAINCVSMIASGAVRGASLLLSGAASAASYSASGEIAGPKAKFTAEGGFAVKLVNKTGAESVKGTIVSLSTGTDNAFALSAVDSSGCVGVVYESGKADAAECWVVVKGIAETLFTNNVTHGQYARVPIAGDTDEVAGKAVGAAIPANTFNTDAYLARFGFVLESKNAGSLAKVLLD